MSNPAPHAEKYYDLILMGLGYLNRARYVPVRKGKPYLAVEVVALHGSESDLRDPEHRKLLPRIDCRVVGAEAQLIVDALLPDIEARKTVLVGFKIGDLTAPQAFTYAKGAKAGESGLCQKARLLKIDWVKVDGQHVALPQRIEAEGSVPEGADDSAPEDQSSANVPPVRNRSAKKVA